MFAISGWLKTAHHEGARAYLGGGSKAWRFFALDAATGELSWYAGARGGGAADPDPAVAAPKVTVSDFLISLSSSVSSGCVSRTNAQIWSTVR